MFNQFILIFKKINHGIVFFTFILFSFSNCVKDDDYQIPVSDCENKWIANKSIKEILDYNNTNLPKEILEDFFIEGYVVSSDEAGNFYKSISIQNSITNPTAGIQIEIDKSNLYLDFPIGSKILINLKGLFIGKDRGIFKIGEKYISGTEERIGRINATKLNQFIQRSCDPISEIKPIEFQDFMSLADDKYLNQLVAISTVQIADKDLGNTFATTFPEASSENRLLIDREEELFILRNSGFSDFANQKMPEGSGSIIAVLSKYNNDYQLIIRSINDINFQGPRYIPPDEFPPKGGSSITYFSKLNETFESYSTGTDVFSKYINDPILGSKYWKLASFSNNKYINLSAFSSVSSGKEAKNKVYFIIPVNFTDASKFSFKSKDGYNTGNVLKIYYSLNYIPLGNIDESLLIDITPEFIISSGNTNGYAPNFISSGVFNIPDNIIGNGFIIFEYSGGYSYSPAVTTTMQLDDIVIE